MHVLFFFFFFFWIVICRLCIVLQIHRHFFWKFSKLSSLLKTTKVFESVTFRLNYLKNLGWWAQDWTLIHIHVCNRWWHPDPSNSNRYELSNSYFICTGATCRNGTSLWLCDYLGITECLRYLSNSLEKVSDDGTLVYSSNKVYDAC